jgi:5'-phosphate synthase pdxT subunit
VTVGVLALQGDVREHVAALAGLGEPAMPVRVPEALDGGLPVFGTCAGMILLAGEVLDGRPDQRRFGVIDLTVRRNGYGRQRASFECELHVDRLEGGPVHAVFIRAPVVERAGADVDVLARLPGAPEAHAPNSRPDHLAPVLCRQGPVLVTSFHPELTGDRRLHQLFVEMTKEERR